MYQQISLYIYDHVSVYTHSLMGDFCMYHLSHIPILSGLL